MSSRTSIKSTHGGRRKGAGRHPADPALALTARAVVRLTESERRKLTRYAEAEGLTDSAVLRARLVDILYDPE